jgi:hypothetical protein
MEFYDCLTPADHARLEKDLLREQAISELARAKTDAWIGSFGTMAGVITGVAGSSAFLLPATIAAVAVGLSIHHLNKGIALAKEANEPTDLSIREPVYQGTLAEEPALVR